MRGLSAQAPQVFSKSYLPAQAQASTPFSKIKPGDKRKIDQHGNSIHLFNIQNIMGTYYLHISVGIASPALQWRKTICEGGKTPDRMSTQVNSSSEHSGSRIEGASSKVKQKQWQIEEASDRGASARSCGPPCHSIPSQEYDPLGRDYSSRIC